MPSLATTFLVALGGAQALLVQSGMSGLARPLAPRAAAPLAVVEDISSTEEFEAALKEAGDALVVVDYSTSWCGPCKIIAPKFDEMSEKYTSVKFLKVRANATGS